MLKELLKQRPSSPSGASKTVLDRIIKGHYTSLYNAALLLQENANLPTLKKKKR